MRMQVIGAASRAPGHPLSTFLIDGVLALDAGALGWFDSIAAQARIRHILLTHSHIDHLAGLPVLLDNVYGLHQSPPVIHGLPETLAAIQQHLFNDRLMPDFVELSRRMSPFLELRELTPAVPVTLDRYQIIPIALPHTVPTVGFLVDDGQAAILFLTDTLPAAELIPELPALRRLRAVFLEASFPDSLQELARISRHLTSSQFLEWSARYPADVPVYAIHIKPRYAQEVRAEILKAGRRNTLIAEPDLIVEL